MRFILFFLLLSVYGFSQSELTDLKFETNYYDASDRWVAFPKIGEEMVFDFGYIFLDVHTGFSYKYESKFRVEGNEIAQIKNDTTVGFVKFLLDENTKKVSVLNKAQQKALNLPDEPSWLKSYKKGQGNIKYLIKEGFYYNAAGASEKALPTLMKAYKKDPHYPGLEYELGFAYNALGDFKKAIEILDKAIDNDPLNLGFYKEIGYSYENLDRIEEAEKMYKLGINLSDEKSFKIGIALRMVQYYFIKRKKSKFEEWANAMLSFSENDQQYQNYIKTLANKWDKN